MGNCLSPASSSMEWGGEDWSCLKSVKDKSRRRSRSSKVFDEGYPHMVVDGLMSLGNVDALRASCDANGKVKIKVSKKELAELMAGIGKQNLQQQIMKKQITGRASASAEQVLFRLIKAKAHANANDHHWRPMLHSIPED